MSCSLSAAVVIAITQLLTVACQTTVRLPDDVTFDESSANQTSTHSPEVTEPEDVQLGVQGNDLNDTQNTSTDSDAQHPSYEPSTVGLGDDAQTTVPPVSSSTPYIFSPQDAPDDTITENSTGLTTISEDPSSLTEGAQTYPSSEESTQLDSADFSQDDNVSEVPATDASEDTDISQGPTPSSDMTTQIQPDFTSEQTDINEAQNFTSDENTSVFSLNDTAISGEQNSSTSSPSATDISEDQNSTTDDEVRFKAYPEDTSTSETVSVPTSTEAATPAENEVQPTVQTATEDFSDLSVATEASAGETPSVLNVTETVTSTEADIRSTVNTAPEDLSDVLITSPLTTISVDTTEVPRELPESTVSSISVSKDTTPSLPPQDVKKVLSSTVLPTPGTNDTHKIPHDNTVEKWQRMEKNLRKMMNQVIQTILPRVTRMLADVDMSEDCQISLLRMIAGLRRGKEWAFRMLDSSGKLPAGLVEGGMTAFGSYDECLDVVVYEDSVLTSRRQSFVGQYCTALLRPPLPKKPRFYSMGGVLPGFANLSQENTLLGGMAKFAHIFYFLGIRYGACLPSTCSIEDARGIADKVGGLIGGYNATVERCEVKEEHRLQTQHIVVIAVFAVLGVLLIFGTAVDVIPQFFVQDEKKQPERRGYFMTSLLAFSVNKNAENLLKTDLEAGTLASLHGLRCFTITWIVIAHTYIYLNFQMFGRLTPIVEYGRNFAFQALANATLSVDTFFLISGILTTYVVIVQVKQRKQQFNVPVYILYRYWRLTPSYLLVIGFFILVPLFGNGPMWNEIVLKYSDRCKQNWWTNILYINNIVRLDKECLGHTWFLACDMQLHILSLIVILPLLRNPKIGLTIMATLLVGSIVSTGLVTYIFDLPPAMLVTHPDPMARQQFRTFLYGSFYPHAGAYCIGLAAGYLLATRPVLHMKPVVVAAGWIAAFACNICVLYATYDWNNGKLPSRVATAIYAGMHRVVWALGVVWLTIACHYGYGGIVNKVVTWKGFIIPSRLTYLIYLLHPILLMVMIAAFRSLFDASHYMAAMGYFGHIWLSCLLSAGATLVSESPFIILGKMLFGRGVRKNVRKDTKGLVSKPSLHRVGSIDLSVAAAAVMKEPLREKYMKRISEE